MSMGETTGGLKGILGGGVRFSDTAASMSMGETTGGLKGILGGGVRYF